MVGLDFDKVFVVAEIGTNHLCDIELAKLQIRQAAKAGANGVKFQIFDSRRLVVPGAKPYWKCPTEQLEYYSSRDRFTFDDYKELFDYAYENGVLPFASVFDEESLQILVRLNSKLVKVASCEITNYDLLKSVGYFQIPVVLSTGGATSSEITTATAIISARGCNIAFLLCCTLSYPTKIEDANLARIRMMRKLYPYIIGYSDHTVADYSMVVPSLAVAYGARMIERHFDCRVVGVSRDGFTIGVDYFRKMVHNIRIAEESRGDEAVGRLPCEWKALCGARRSVVAVMDIRKGEKIQDYMVEVKRPRIGIPSEYLELIMGMEVNRNIEAGEFLQWRDLEEVDSLVTKEKQGNE